MLDREQIRQLGWNIKDTHDCSGISDVQLEEEILYIWHGWERCKVESRDVLPVGKRNVAEGSARVLMDQELPEQQGVPKT